MFQGGTDMKKILAMLLTGVMMLSISSFAFAEEAGFDEWYRTSFSDKDGIYIGTGAGDQQLIKINNYDKELALEYKNDIGFQITEGMYKLVKLIEFEKIEEEDEDE